jgi:hypothetical protein
MMFIPFLISHAVGWLVVFDGDNTFCKQAGNMYALYNSVALRQQTIGVAPFLWWGYIFVSESSHISSHNQSSLSESSHISSHNQSSLLKKALKPHQIALARNYLSLYDEFIAR